MVEDNPGDVTLIRHALRESGPGVFDLTIAENMGAAQAQLSEKAFDVVLLDLSLPDSMGLDTVSGIRQAHGTVAIVVLSGLDDEELAVQAVKSGAQDYLVKGRSDSESLRRAIRYAIERQRIEQAMRLAEAVFNNSETGIIVTDLRGVIVRANPAFSRITGYDARDIVGQPVSILKSGVQDAQFYAEMWRGLNENGHWEGEIWNRRKSGEVYPEWLRIDAVPDSGGRPMHYVAIFSDITFRKEIEDQLRLQATHDTLTGLPNRYLFTDRLKQSLAQAQRSNTRVALLFVDLDGFKNVNDQYGHSAGDQLLMEVAERLRQLVRASDTVARLAGDEFTVILPGLVRKSDASTVAGKIVESLSLPYALDAGPARVSASVGIAFFPDDAQDIDKLIIAADSAMYRVKQGSKNSFAYFEPAA
ncbi:MAG: diguanylate cyclase [Rhodospirillales bacterium]|nr:diguanylate cyclase [Rhodospirillales bacterium]